MRGMLPPPAEGGLGHGALPREVVGVGGHVRWPFPERELLRVGQGIALGLAAMHSKGYSHRDMKPHNVLMYVYLSVNLI